MKTPLRKSWNGCSLEKSGYVDGEFADQLYEWRFKCRNFKGDKKPDEVVVSRNTADESDWQVQWGDAVDYDGDKAGLLKRYPEFKKFLK